MPAEWDRFKLDDRTSHRSPAGGLQDRRRRPDQGGARLRRKPAEQISDQRRLGVGKYVGAGLDLRDGEFQFEWAPDVITGHNIYWVEAMMDYRPSAYRLLLSSAASRRD